MADGYNKAKDTSFARPLWDDATIPDETSPKEYEFKACDIKFIQAFIKQRHYSRSANVAAMYCFALISKKKGIVGACIYSKPAMNSIYKLYADSEEQVLELRRLVCIDETPKNTESYFVGKTLKWLIKNTTCKTVVTYADPSFGHVGHAYRACNFVYDGKAGDTVVLELPVEHCVHHRACEAEGKAKCQVHDRNMRCKTKDGRGYTPQAIKLRELYNQGIAQLVSRETKHRYHYHLEEKRTETKQKCRQCDELSMASLSEKEVMQKLADNFFPVAEPFPQKGLNAVIAEPKKIEIKETSESYIPENYIIEEKEIQLTKENIGEYITKAWSADTSYWKEKWSKENPAIGQAAVTALLVQEILGGELLRCEVEGFGSHYFNKLPDGSIMDLTKQQFPDNIKMTKPVVKDANYVLQFAPIKKRFNLLKERFEKA